MFVVYFFPSGETQARFRRRSTHLPNPSDKFITAKERRLNQFGTAILVWAPETPSSTEFVALFVIGVTRDSYGTPLKCRT